MGRKLTVVARLAIRSPCDASWDAMEPRAQGRHCASCDRVVHEVADMTRAEAIALAKRLDRGERICRRVHRRRADGAIWTAEGFLEPEPEPEPAPARPRKILVMATVGAAAALTACAAPEASTARARVPAPVVIEPARVVPPPAPEIAAPPPIEPSPPEAEVQKILVERYPRGEAPNPFAVAPKLPKAPPPPPPPKTKEKPAKKATPAKPALPGDETDVMGGY